MSIVTEKIALAKAAMEQIKDYTQEQVDKLVYEGGKAIYKNAVTLAEHAVAESGIGAVADNIEMNRMTAATFYDYLKDKKSVGIIAEHPEIRMMEVAHPVGVVAGITPSTVPVTTVCGNFMHAIKGKNALVICPAPRAIVACLRSRPPQVPCPRAVRPVCWEPSPACWARYKPPRP